jgi:eukaryotic-like serine/threonine-protein kinase
MVNRTRHLYEFGPFRVDPDHRQLLRQGQPVPLQPKAFDVLLVLVENSEKVVSKDDLIKTVWPDTFVEESNLSQHIFVLRKALGDAVEEKRYIVTVPGRGYRFAEKVALVADEDGNGRQEVVKPSAPESVDDQERLVVASHTRSRMLVEEQLIPFRTLPLPHRTWLKYTIGVICILVAAGAFYFLRHRPAHGLSRQDTVVLADFTNRTGDSVFDDTLKTALDIAVSQSPFLNPLSGNKVRNTLRLMARPPATKVTPEVAREICQRTGGKAYIDGSIVQLGTEYVLTLEASDCQSGETMALEQKSAPTKEKVLGALGDAATNLRTALGESLTTVQKFDTPLPQITTSSLDALKAYSLGRKFLYQMDPGSALPYFQHALELDPNFAMAYVDMGNTDLGFNDIGLAGESFAKAFSLRDHTSNLEKLQIDAEYYGYTTGELDKALRALLEDREYKHNTVYLGLADVYSRLGQYDKSAEAARTLLARDPDYGLAFIDLASDELALHDFPGARQAIQQAQARGMDIFPMHNLLYTLAFLQSETAGMAEQQQWSATHSGFQQNGFALAADSEAYSAHLSKARQLTSQAVDSAMLMNDKQDAARYRASRALQEAAYGNSAEARRSANESLKLARGNPYVASQAALALAIAGDGAQAAALALELNQRFPVNTQVQKLVLPAINAQLQLAGRQPAIAVNTLQVALPVEFASTPFSSNTLSCLYPTYVRGEAYLATSQGAQAAAEFQKIIDHSGVVGICWTGALARLGLARAYRLEAGTGHGTATASAAGDTNLEADPSALAKAQAAYQDFLTLWKDADPNTPILKEAKAEYAKLK